MDDLDAKNQELAIADAAVTDADRRYQAREREMRAASRQLDDAFDKSVEEFANPPSGYRTGPCVPEDRIVGIANPVMPPVERYTLVSVDIPGGCIHAALGRNPGEPIGHLRGELTRVIVDESARLDGRPVSDDNAFRLSDALDARLRETWPHRAWWAETWMTGQDEEPLTQVYAPWGRPRVR